MFVAVRGRERRRRRGRALVASRRGRRRRSVDSVDGRRGRRSQAARRPRAARRSARLRSASSSSRTTSGCSRGGASTRGRATIPSAGRCTRALLGAAWSELPARDSRHARLARQPDGARHGRRRARHECASRKLVATRHRLSGVAANANAGDGAVHGTRRRRDLGARVRRPRVLEHAVRWARARAAHLLCERFGPLDVRDGARRRRPPLVARAAALERLGYSAADLARSRAPTPTSPSRTDAFASTSRFGTRSWGSSSATEAGWRAPSKVEARCAAAGRAESDCHRCRRERLSTRDPSASAGS